MNKEAWPAFLVNDLIFQLNIFRKIVKIILLLTLKNNFILLLIPIKLNEWHHFKSKE